MAAGYAARKLRLLGERTARVVMTIVMVGGYSSVQLLAVWNAKLSASLVLLPILGGVNIALMSLVGIGVARAFTRDRAEIGIFSVASGAPNTGVTMGGLVLLALYGDRGLELMSIYCIMWMPVIICVMYPIARHYSPNHGGGSLGKLMLRSIFDWRSIGLPMACVGLVLNLVGIARPQAVTDLHLVGFFMIATMSLAYFAIGLRVSFRGAAKVRRMLAGLVLTRFVVSGLLAAGMAWLVTRIGLPFGVELRNVLVIESIMPAAVATVAVANMFELHPARASTLFVINTLMFLGLVLPAIYWIFG